MGINGTLEHLRTRKWLPAGKSTCRGLLQQTSRSYDDRTIAGTQSTVQAIEAVQPGEV